MRQFLRILLAAGVIAFATSMTAASCGKTADPNNNANTNTNTDGGSGGDGNGGDGGNKYTRPTAIADAGAIKIINVNTSIAKVDTTTTIPTIRIKASGLDKGIGSISTPNSLWDALEVSDTQTFKAFEITNEKAKEGLVLVGKGNLASADKITTRALVTTYPNDATGNDGIHPIRAATANGSGKIPAGLSFLSAFADKTAPTDSFNNTEPFAFSTYTAIVRGMNWPTSPVFWCTSNVPALATAIAATDKLTGGNKATCHVGVLHQFFDATTITDWFAAAAPFKREIQVAFTAIRTDDWTIGDLLSDGTAAANVSAFTDGISDAEMKRITESNSKPVPFKKYNIKIVTDTDFAAP